MLDPRLNHFVAVVRCGSFTAAARDVGVTQSAVTKSIADLERQLGHELFQRTTRGVKVTDTGRDIAERAARLLDDARELLRGSSSQNGALSGVLRIGVCPASLEWCLPEPVARFSNRYRNMRFETTGASVIRTIQHLQNGGNDVVIGFEAALAEWPDIQIERVGTMQIVPFVRRGHPLSGTRCLTTTELTGYDWVSPSDARPFSDILSELYDGDADQWRDHLHLIDSFSVARRLVASSDAIGIASTADLSVPGFDNDFVVLNGGGLFEAEPVCCATRARRDPSYAMRAFISAVRQAFLDVVPCYGHPQRPNLAINAPRVEAAPRRMAGVQ